MDLERLTALVREQNSWRANTINLIASENEMLIEKEGLEELYCNDFMHRYAEGEPYKRYYNGTKYIDEIESATVQHFAQHFNAGYVDVKPLSGAMANLIVILSLPKRALLMTNALPAGGHITHNEMGTAGLFSRVVNFPVSEDTPYTMDVDKALHLIERFKPDALILGKSLFLHPEPVRELREAYDGLIIYDAAHVFGLIYGNAFQQPLEEGADIMTASTHKTFPGPQGGIIIAKTFWKDLKRVSFPGLLSNHHLHRLPALLATALLLDGKHRDYPKRVVENAQAFAEALAEEGFKVEGYDGKRYTHTHQVVVDVSPLGGGAKVADVLEKEGIIVNKNALPRDKSVLRPSGIRMGTQEQTLRGWGKEDFRALAERLAKLLGVG